MSSLNKSNTIIVSPSGQFYGSEQVLFNHLEHTAKRYLAFVPTKGKFSQKLKKQNKHKVSGFSNLRVLYLRLLYKLVFQNYNTLYVNEGGHIKFAKIIAMFLPYVKVIVHIRLLEDTESNRLGKLPKNLKLISISNYIRDVLLPEYPSVMIYDPLDASKVSTHNNQSQSGDIRVGIIGRVSLTKGLKNYDQLFKYYFGLNGVKYIHFIFFGDILQKEEEASLFFDNYKGKEFPQIEFKGFIEDQEKIFSSIDAVLHLNEKEPLGRIGLESWARGIPFVCFNAGGCAEINETLEMERFSVAFDTDWEEAVIELISSLKNFSSSEQENARLNLQSYFSIERYLKQLEKQF